MTSIPEIQQKLFSEIAIKIPANRSVVQEIAGLLGISDDSVYRRMRGEKELSLPELQKICTQYMISLDSLLNINSHHVIFNTITVGENDAGILSWMENVLAEMKRISGAASKEVIFAAIDLPFFHFAQVPELLAFKIYLWEKTLLLNADGEEKKFSMEPVDPLLGQVISNIVTAWNGIPTVEIWNEDNFNIILRQIEFSRQAGYIEKKEEADLLYAKLSELSNHIYRQAEQGRKFAFGKKLDGECSFKLFENEIVLNDNTIFIRTNESQKIYLTFNMMSLLASEDRGLCRYTQEYLKRILSKSNLISVSGNKERARLFNHLRERILLYQNRNV